LVDPIVDVDITITADVDVVSAEVSVDDVV
jgi:hypothetical protein